MAQNGLHDETYAFKAQIWYYGDMLIHIYMVSLKGPIIPMMVYIIFQKSYVPRISPKRVPITSSNP